MSKDDFISLDNIDNIVDFLKKSGQNKISLLGGEPTLHPEIIPIIEKLRHEKLTISVKSNGLWPNELNKYWAKLKDKELYFLLNLNPPSEYSDNQLKILKHNISNIINQDIVLSINIDKPDFDYDYILDYANEYNVKYIRWSFAHPIYNRKQKLLKQSYFHINKYKQSSNRIIEFIKKAGDIDIMTLGDHSVIKCMFSDKQHQQILDNNGEINSRCEGTIEILPDLQVIFCLPMFSLFEKIYLTEFSNMNELEQFLESKIDILRKNSLPFEECNSCKYFLRNECHGGCLSHRIFSPEILKKFYTEWSYDLLKDEQLNFSPDFELLKNGKQASIKSSDINIEVSEFVIDFLTLFNGNKTLENILNELNIEISSYKSEIDKLLVNCQKYKILELK